MRRWDRLLDSYMEEYRAKGVSPQTIARRLPHIVTVKEEEQLLAVASDVIRVLAVLILDTGLRSGREALALRWEDVDSQTNQS